VLCYVNCCNAIVTVMNEKPVRNPRSVKIDPEALHRTQGGVMRSKKEVGEWLEETIQEKVERIKEP